MKMIISFNTLQTNRAFVRPSPWKVDIYSGTSWGHSPLCSELYVSVKISIECTEWVIPANLATHSLSIYGIKNTWEGNPIRGSCSLLITFGFDINLISKRKNSFRQQCSPGKVSRLVRGAGLGSQRNPGSRTGGAPRAADISSASSSAGEMVC